MLRTTLKTVSLSLLTALPVWAGDLPAPTGEVILTLSGNITVTNGESTAQLDLAMLEAMAPATIETTTIWTEGTQVFEGVSLATLVSELGLSGETLRAKAINDYEVAVPLADAVEGGPIIAYRLNGEAMSVRDKGPLWIIYPYDADADYRTEIIYSRSIWQLDRIEAVD